MGDVLIKARTRNDGKTVYEYRFEIAFVEGKRKWKSKSGFATKREAREEGKIAQQAYEQVGQAVEPSDMSYSDFPDLWIEKNCKLTCKESTIKGYIKDLKIVLQKYLTKWSIPRMMLLHLPQWNMNIS